MRALSLFSGIGGIDLAAEWAGIETVAFCERDPFCQKVLVKHWPNTPIYDDVCTLTKERLEADGIDTRTIGLIHGGYPCQPFSNAGQRKGTDDDRHLWPEVKRLLETIRPRWFVGENVAGHITLGLDEVLNDLADIGYTSQPFNIPACGVGADHKRERIFIIAHSLGIEGDGKEKCEINENWSERMQERIIILTRPSNISEHAANANSKYVERSSEEEIQGQQRIPRFIHPGSAKKWSRRSTVYQPKLSRTHNGLPDQVDRIKSLGNAVVPQQIYPILAAIKQIDDMLKEQIA